MKLATLCYVIDKKTNSTLMLHRVKKVNDYHEGKWNGLGGKFEQGESPEECAIREIEEECGLKVKSVAATAAKAMPGITDIVTFGNNVAVVGKSTWQATKARKATTGSAQTSPCARCWDRRRPIT